MKLVIFKKLKKLLTLKNLQTFIILLIFAAFIILNDCLRLKYCKGFYILFHLEIISITVPIKKCVNV